MSVPGFYTRAAFAGSAQAAVEIAVIHDELFGVRRGLANAHNNLNQIARGVNYDGTLYEEQLVSVLDSYERLVARLDLLLGPIEERSPTRAEE